MRACLCAIVVRLYVLSVCTWIGVRVRMRMHVCITLVYTLQICCCPFNTHFRRKNISIAFFLICSFVHFFSSIWLSHIFLGSCSDFRSLANYNKTIASDLQPISYKQRIRSQLHIKSSVIYWPLLDSIPFDLIEFRIATEFNANEICHGQLILDTNYCNTFPLQLMIEWIEKKTSQMYMIVFMLQIEQFSNFFKIFFGFHGNIGKFSRIFNRIHYSNKFKWS